MRSPSTALEPRCVRRARGRAVRPGRRHLVAARRRRARRGAGAGGSTGRWVYVSSRSVYAWPIPQRGDESAPRRRRPTRTPTPPTTPPTSAVRSWPLERELGRRPRRPPARRSHPRARARTSVGCRGGCAGSPAAATSSRPVPSDLGIQYVDARDLAALRARRRCRRPQRPGRRRLAGRAAPRWASCSRACVDVTGSDARLVWIDARARARPRAIEPWSELPVWMPLDDVEMYALHTERREPRARVGPAHPTRCTRPSPTPGTWVRSVDAVGRRRPSRAPASASTRTRRSTALARVGGALRPRRQADPPRGVRERGRVGAVRGSGAGQASASRSARLTALTTALSDDVTIDGSMPTPHRTRPPTAHSR